MSKKLSRRVIVAALAASAAAAPTAAAAQSPYRMIVYRGAGCGCCAVWNAHLNESGRFAADLRTDADLAGTKQRLGVPGDLYGCHTAEVEGYVVEGHVPPQDILRLLAERPAHIRGLAVAGMPVGSPGMEIPSGRRDAFDVIAFHHDGAREVYASYAAIG